MKKILLILAGLLAVGLVYLGFAGRYVQVIETEIEIAAPPLEVWKTLQDIDAWQNWSPIIVKSSGKWAEGEKLDITMCGEKGKDGEVGPRYEPVIIKIEESKYFHWRAHMLAGFIFTNDKIFELTETAGGTKLVHKELFNGMLAPIFCGQMEAHVPEMLDSMNKALKELVEK
jgi:hypothetical protein